MLAKPDAARLDELSARIAKSDEAAMGEIGNLRSSVKRLERPDSLQIEAAIEDALVASAAALRGELSGWCEAQLELSRSDCVARQEAIGHATQQNRQQLEKLVMVMTEVAAHASRWPARNVARCRWLRLAV